jgi:molybdate transport system substrate-binding protein
MRTFSAILIILAVLGCSPAEEAPAPAEGKSLLVLCGITMIEPVRELMDIFGQEHGVRVTMSYGGSADLLQSIVVSGKGDIYFPGAESFIAEADRSGVIGERRQVGLNQAALFVRKGNPLGLTGELGELTRDGLQVAIGHPDLGSVGKEAQRILSDRGLYDEVVARAAVMAADSKALSAALREGKADVALNWKAVHAIGDNAAHMDMIPIQGGFATTHRLTMAVTACTREPGLALAFLELCESARGRAIFARHGF